MGEWYCLSQVMNSAHPADTAFDARSVTRMWNGTGTPKIEIPFKIFFGQIVFFDLFFEIFQIHRPFAAADYFAVALRGE